jgi:hypothetical protein
MAPLQLRSESWINQQVNQRRDDGKPDAMSRNIGHSKNNRRVEMKGIHHFALALIAAVSIAACSNDKRPGPLEGTWQMSGAMPMIISFRDGETEAMGMIEKVSYKIEGNDVLVTYLDGMAKGTTMRYTMTGPDSARTAFGTLRRIK